jgi:Cu(I)/Ag(I) efflux system membrane fusion protein
MSKSGGIRSSIAGAAIAVGLLSIVLLVQHLRHGWPFSLHHGLGSRAAGTKTSVPVQSSSGSAPRTTIELDPARLDAIGVRMERTRVERIGEALRVIATIVPDETRVSHVHTRVAGWIEQLYVSTTGQSVRAGQPLAAIFPHRSFYPLRTSTCWRSVRCLKLPPARCSRRRVLG